MRLTRRQALMGAAAGAACALGPLDRTPAVAAAIDATTVPAAAGGGAITTNFPLTLDRTSIFNRPLGANDPLDPNQGPVGALVDQIYYGRTNFIFRQYSGVGYGNYPWPGSLGFAGPSRYSHPVYWVDSSDPSNCDVQQVALYFHDKYGYHPWATPAGIALQAKFNAVPIPKASLCPGIKPGGDWATLWAAGTDCHMTIVDRETKQCWEGWLWTDQLPVNIKAAFPNARYGVQWGGYVDDVEHFDGVFPNGWGSRATSLASVGGLITYQDIWNCYYGIPACHALTIACPMNSGKAVPPATRGDGPGANNVRYIPGTTTPNPAYGKDATTEGQWFRFPPGTDFSSNPYPMARMIGEQVRDYGMVIGDTSGAVAFYIADGRTFGSVYDELGPDAPNPWPPALDWTKVQRGPDPRWGATPAGQSILHTLDWTKLQLLAPRQQ